MPNLETFGKENNFLCLPKPSSLLRIFATVRTQLKLKVGDYREYCVGD